MKPTLIIDKVEFFIGVFGILAVIYNMWNGIFVVEKVNLDLFVYSLMALVATFYFTWLIVENIRWNRYGGGD